VVQRNILTNKNFLKFLPPFPPPKNVEYIYNNLYHLKKGERGKEKQEDYSVKGF
jgi:hypothetical protein